MQKYLEEVRRELKKKENKKRAQHSVCYLNTKYKCLGLAVPLQRAAHKKGYSFLKKPESEINRIWNYIWQQADTFEVFSQCLLYYAAQKKDLTLRHWNFLKTWALKIDNWENSDRLCDLFAEFHERYPKQIHPTFKKWNKSKKPWLRRISIVSLFYYSSSRQKQPVFNKVLPLVNNLLYDKDVYVQKGVGWTLRELYNVYPKKTYAYLLKHSSDLAPASWQAATEKLSKKDKARLKTIRQKK